MKFVSFITKKSYAACVRSSSRRNVQDEVGKVEESCAARIRENYGRMRVCANASREYREVLCMFAWDRSGKMEG